MIAGLTKRRLATIIIVAALIGSALATLIILPKEEIWAFRGLYEIPWKKAKPDVGTPKADSDFVDVNLNGKFDEGIDIRFPDMLSDIEENYRYGTNATNPDTDADGMVDGWEAMFARKNPVTGRLTIDPLKHDALGNPDGDGFDDPMEGLPGIFDGEADKSHGGENLTNLEEYCGGSIPEEFDPERDLITGVSDEKVGTERVEGIMSYGYHIFVQALQEARRAGAYVKPKLLNPSDPDSDDDGIDDGYELHYAEVCAEIAAIDPNYYHTIDPLNASDAMEDIDIGNPELGPGEYGDGLTNLQEYENHTDPTQWDTDMDSYLREYWDEDKKELVTKLYPFDDKTEIELWKFIREELLKLYGFDEYGRCLVPFSLRIIGKDRPDPTKNDTDGDCMQDGWEAFWGIHKGGLSPVNASDRFLDIDHDGLQNYLEYAFPDIQNKWFETDPLTWDTDGDGMPDGWEAFHAQPRRDAKIHPEYEFTVNPMVPDASMDLELPAVYDYDLDGIPEEHPCGDNLSNYLEYTGTTQYPTGTDPSLHDTDGDWLADGKELATGFAGELIGDVYYTNPNFCGIYYTNATNQDSDMDFDPDNITRRVNDWEEIFGTFQCLVNGIDDDRDAWDLQHNELDDDGDGIVDDGRTSENGTILIPAFGKPEGVDEPDEAPLRGDGSVLTSWKPMNATNPDTDIDGLTDVDELFGIWTGEFDPLDWTSGIGWAFPNPCNKDTDFDGLKDKEECVYGEDCYITDPSDPDTDDDMLWDGKESTTDFWPVEDIEEAVKEQSGLDYDAKEIDGTNPRFWDTDADGLPDGWEAEFGQCWDINIIIEYCEFWELEVPWDYLDPDDDGVLDKPLWVINPLYGYDANTEDTTNEDVYDEDTYDEDLDGDGVLDEGEDRDGDGDLDLPGNRELDEWDGETEDKDGDGKLDFPGNGELDPGEDLDHDGKLDVPGNEELDAGEDTNGNGKLDLNDWDHDGLDNRAEYENGTDPLKWDTDGDGLPDGWELPEPMGGFARWVFDPFTNRYGWNLDPLDPTDADKDPDCDGVLYILTHVDDDYDGKIDEDPVGKIDDSTVDPNIPWDDDGDGLIDEDPEESEFYHPFTNLDEFWFGIPHLKYPWLRTNTTHPNKPDTDMDSIPDGWEIWYTDHEFRYQNRTPGRWEDDDKLPKGWEDLFNCSITEFDYYDAGMSNGIDDDGDGEIDENDEFDAMVYMVDPDLKPIENASMPPDYIPYALRAGLVGFIGLLNSSLQDSGERGATVYDPPILYPNGIPDGAEDYDEDGFNNTVEYLTNTDPTDSNSYPNGGGSGGGRARSGSNSIYSYSGNDKSKSKQNPSLSSELTTGTATITITSKSPIYNHQQQLGYKTTGTSSIVTICNIGANIIVPANNIVTHIRVMSRGLMVV